MRFGICYYSREIFFFWVKYLKNLIYFMVFTFILMAHGHRKDNGKKYVPMLVADGKGGQIVYRRTEQKLLSRSWKNCSLGNSELIAH